MNRWKELAQELAAQEAERLEAERASREAIAARAELWSWSRATSANLMQSLKNAADERADQLAIETGVRVRARGPERITLQHANQPAEVHVVRLACRQREVLLYGFATPGALPLVHFLNNGDVGWVPASRRHRLLSLPGCRIARRPDGSTVLRPVGGDGVSEPSDELSLDDLVFRGFELLLRRDAFARSARALRGSDIATESPPSEGPLVASPEGLTRVLGSAPE